MNGNINGRKKRRKRIIIASIIVVVIVLIVGVAVAFSAFVRIGLQLDFAIYPRACGVANLYSASQPEGQPKTVMRPWRP